MDFDQVNRGIATAIGNYRCDTNLDPNVEFLKLHVHPTDMADIRAFGKSLYFEVDRLLEEKGLFGIPFVVDDTVEAGHPRLKCFWEWVL